MISFQTVSNATTSQLTEKGSRFLGFLFPASHRGEIDTALEQVRADLSDCKQICYAWRLGADELANDAGEPAHSAGAPILRQLKSAGITHGLLVVARYFGGTKLGISGLIQAYGAAAQLAIAETEVIPWIEKVSLRLQFAYEQTAFMDTLKKQYAVEVTQADYGTHCEQTWQIALADLSSIEDTLLAAQISYSPPD